MTEAQQSVVRSVREGKDGVQAIADAYELSRTDAFKRLGRVLKHREVNSAIGASPFLRCE
jgi:hypothetical protein